MMNINNNNQMTLDIILKKPKRISFPLSWVQHIPFSFYLISELQPKVIVELGTHTGNSLCCFAQAINDLKLSAKCFAIDTWQGDNHAGAYDKTVYDDLFNYCKDNYSSSVVLKKMLFEEAVYNFADYSIDLLHIDGLHTYEAVKSDFSLWKNKMSSDGVVLFHDTQVRHSDFGVYKFWSEIKDTYPSFEFKFGHGLGLLFVGNNHLQLSSNRVLEFVTSAQNYEIFKLAGLSIDLETQLQNSKIIESSMKNRLNLILNSRSYQYSQKALTFFKSIIKFNI
jgi:hypothetical protein